MRYLDETQHSQLLRTLQLVRAMLPHISMGPSWFDFCKTGTFQDYINNLEKELDAVRTSPSPTYATFPVPTNPTTTNLGRLDPPPITNAEQAILDNLELNFNPNTIIADFTRTIRRVHEMAIWNNISPGRLDYLIYQFMDRLPTQRERDVVAAAWHTVTGLRMQTDYPNPALWGGAGWGQAWFQPWRTETTTTYGIDNAHETAQTTPAQTPAVDAPPTTTDGTDQNT